MVTDKWRKRRVHMFPEIKDWTDPQNHYRYSNIHEVSHKYWLWFHPSAFKLIKYGTPTSACITFTIAAYWFHYNGNTISSYVFAFLATVMVYEIIRLIVKKAVPSDTNMYDTFMREYQPIGDKVK